MIKAICDECGKEVRRGSIAVVSCTIKPNKFKYISTIKVTGYNNFKNTQYPHRKLCKDCMRVCYHSLQNDNMKNIISLELLSLISGKASKIAICNSLEAGNGK